MTQHLTPREHPAATMRREKPVTLYYGDNGSHEFYETAKDEPRHLLIIRHHERTEAGELRSGPDDKWFVLECEFDTAPTPIYRGWMPLSALIRNIAETCHVAIAIDPHHQWQDVSQRRMKLLPVA